MISEKPDKKTVLRYILLQLPGVILAFIAALMLLNYTKWPSWLIWTVFGLWILKDGVLFFLVWPSYRSSDKEKDPLVGQMGLVIKSCQPEGIVEIHGTPWRAVIEDQEKSVQAGTKVYITKREGLTLFVQSK